ncbi:MAG: cupin domain-containing protein [Bacteroidota bacterium]|nr:cupin domain-containing protein [Bacteroidota bacterium]
MSNHPSNKVISVQQPLQHDFWGQHCESNTLLDEASLCIKQERMPPGTAEQLHYHQQAQQFFFILNGLAKFEIEGESYLVSAKEGIQIRPGQVHRIVNAGESSLEFILASQPSVKHDRHLKDADTNP